MDQSDVLARLVTTRDRIAQTSEHAQKERDQLQAVFTQIGQHFSEFNNDFNATLAHLQTESARARDAAQEVIDALLKAGQEVTQQAQDNGQSLEALAQNALGAAQANDAGSAALDAHSAQANDRLAQTHTLFDQLRLGSTEARDGQHQAIGELESAITNWKGETDTVSREQHDAADQKVEHLTGPSAQQFAQTVTQQVEQARTALEQQGNELDAFAHQQEEALRNDRENARNDMRRTLDEMARALESLGELVDSTATTLTHGADEAQDLMKLTNIGVRTVIGLIENLQRIFDEIEDAWN